MNIKIHTKNSSTRCRDLRLIEREINNEIGRTARKRASLNNRLQDLRSRKTLLVQRRNRLQNESVGLAFGTLPLGAIGRALAGAKPKHRQELEDVKLQIEELHDQIGTTEAGFDQLETDQRRLETSLDRNAAEMDRLNCVR
ncbi:MAG: hypothetical protein GKR97_16955 [Rhizobiaceae bacterium]|nr:hypothetical protein [Rhizobiaceae bacterium]